MRSGMGSTLSPMLVGCALAGCSLTATDTDVFPEGQGAWATCESADSAHDGVYAATFYTEGEQTAVGAVTVANGIFEADILGLNASVQAGGCVLADGAVVFEELREANGLDVQAEVALGQGAMTGAFILTDPSGRSSEGTIEGSRDNRVREDSHTLFDGAFDVALTMAGQPFSDAVFVVENSGFDGALTTSTGLALQVQGFVTSDGLIVVNGVQGTLDLVLAEGYVDHDSLEGSGVFRLGDQVGVFTVTPKDPA